MLLLGVVLWAQGKIPVSTEEPLSIVSVMIMLAIFVACILFSKYRLALPWYINITCESDAHTFTARNPKDTVVIKKTNLISTELLHSSLRGVTAYGVKISYRQSHEERHIVVEAKGSWRDQSGKLFWKQKRFCEALIAAIER